MVVVKIDNKIIDKMLQIRIKSSMNRFNKAKREYLLFLLMLPGERVFSDLADTYWIIGLALIGACVLSFTWILLIRFLAGGFLMKIIAFY